MSDRIVVMKDGKFCQTGTPAQVYDNPRTEFVAKFVGMANIINGAVMESHDGYSYIMYEDSKLKIKGTAKPGSTVKISVRSENLHVAKEPCENAFAVTADSATYTNGILRLTLNTKNGEKIVSARQGGQSMPEGTGCFAYFAPENAVILEDEI